MARLAGSRLLALVGASGSGKSSALQAGLLAALASDVLPGSGGWRVVSLRPGGHPLRELARRSLAPAQVLTSSLGDAAAVRGAAESVLAAVQRDPDRLTVA